MKKAKMMLLAIAILAITGGALAVKAHSKFVMVAYYQFNTNPDHRRCDVFIGSYGPTIGGDPVTTVLWDVTTLYGAQACNLTTTVVPDPGE